MYVSAQITSVAYFEMARVSEFAATVLAGEAALVVVD